MATTSYFSSLLLNSVKSSSLNSAHRKRVVSPVECGSISSRNEPIRLRTGSGSSTRIWAKVEDKGEILESNCGFLIDTVDDVNDDEQSLVDPSKHEVAEIIPEIPERDYAGTPYVPVYVMLPLNTIDMNCELVDPQNLIEQLKILKSINVDGVMVDCWWGIVEALAPQKYNWSGYKELFQIVRDFGLKLQVVMSFHACGGNVGDDVHIPLPHWITEIGQSNPDIYFTDKEGRRNTESLSWGIDKERVLRGRTAVEVYYDYMRSFRTEFNEFFEGGTISEIEVGLGPCGELRYPSYPANQGWKYPGIGEFQCYDKYLMKSLQKAAEVRGHVSWGRAPDNSGSYNSWPHKTGFFRDGGDYDSYYGRFFLNWYSKVLIDHGDRVLTLANQAFEGFPIAAKLSGIHWWYKTASHAAELTAGFYNSSNRDGYAPIAAMLKQHEAALNFTCVELRTMDQHESYPEALADPEGLVWQVLNAAWDVCIPVASENALTCYDREGYNKILKNAKPHDDPDGKHLSAFTYLRLNPDLMEEYNFMEFERFVKRMHGESVPDLNCPRETSLPESPEDSQDPEPEIKLEVSHIGGAEVAWKIWNEITRISLFAKSEVPATPFCRVSRELLYEQADFFSYSKMFDLEFQRNMNVNILVDARIDIALDFENLMRVSEIFCDSMVEPLHGVSAKHLYLSGKCMEALNCGQPKLPTFNNLSCLNLDWTRYVDW